MVLKGPFAGMFRSSTETISVLRSRLSRDITVTTLLSLFSRGIGLIVPFIIAFFYGVSEVTDAFFFVYSVIMFFTLIFSATLETVLVPLIVEQKKHIEKLNSFLGKITGLTIISFGIVAISVLILMEPATNLCTKFAPSAVMLIEQLAFESSPLVFFTIIGSVLIANLNAHSRFYISAVSPGIRGLAVILMIVSLHWLLGVHAIPVAYCVGSFLCALFLWMSSKKKLDGLKIVPRFHWDAEFKRFIKIAGFQMFGLAAVGFNPVINRAMASWLGSGSISVLEYAEKIYLIPVLLLTSGLFAVILPRWSESAYAESPSNLNREVRLFLGFSFGLSVFVIVPALIALPIIVRALYGPGIEDSRVLTHIHGTAFYYLLGVGPYIMGQLVVRALLALKLTRVIMMISLLKTILNVGLNLVFMLWLGVAGIALSTAVNSVIVFFLLYWALIAQKKNHVESVTVLGADLPGKDWL